MVAYLFAVATVFLVCSGPGGVVAAIGIWIYYAIATNAKKRRDIMKENERLEKYRDRKNSAEYMQLKDNERYLEEHKIF